MYCRFHLAAAVFLLATAPAMSQTSVDFRDAVKTTSPAIVTVKLEGDNASYAWYSLQTSRTYPSAADAVIDPKLFTSKTNPSRAGFAVAADLVISCDVPAESGHVDVIAHDGRALKGKVVVRDQVTGLAGIQLEDEKLATLALSKRGASAGTPVLISWLQDGSTVTSKASMIATDKNADETHLGYTQKLDATLTADKSGAPIVNSHGKVVGVVLSKAGDAIALPTWHVTRIVERASEEEPSDLQRGRIGIQIHDTPDDRDGALIMSLLDDMPAKEAGLEVGDQVLSVDGLPCSTHRDVIAAVAMSRAGDEVTIQIRRKGEQSKHVVKLSSGDAIAQPTYFRVTPTRAFEQIFSLQDGKLVPLPKDQPVTGITLTEKEPKAVVYGLQVERSELEKSLKKLEAENARLKQVVESIKKTLDVKPAEN